MTLPLLDTKLKRWLVVAALSVVGVVAIGGFVVVVTGLTVLAVTVGAGAAAGVAFCCAVVSLPPQPVSMDAISKSVATGCTHTECARKVMIIKNSPPSASV
jgi:hypothetical protein